MLNVNSAWPATTSATRTLGSSFTLGSSNASVSAMSTANASSNAVFAAPTASASFALGQGNCFQFNPCIGSYGGSGRSWLYSSQAYSQSSNAQQGMSQSGDTMMANMMNMLMAMMKAMMQCLMTSNSSSSSNAFSLPMMMMPVLQVQQLSVQQRRHCHCHEQTQPVVPPKPWTVDFKAGANTGTIQLGDNYKLELNEASASWTLTNLKTKVATRVHGDPHVDENNDGKTDWDFKKDASFILDDGTKITVNNAGNEAGFTLSSRLTITNTQTNQAIVVSGLAGGTDGAKNLKIEQRDGQAKQLDDQTSDGSLSFKENTDGHWRFADNNADVNQTEVNQREAKGGKNLWTTNQSLFK